MSKLVKILFNDDSYMIVEEQFEWEYENHPDYKETVEPTEQDITDHEEF